MKKIASLIIISALFITISNAQNNAGTLPEVTTVLPYQLEVGYNTTTVIIFPMPLLPAVDKGSKDIIIQQEKALGNVLKIKADKKDFLPTNLHVYTVDGKLFAFNVAYTEYPSHTTFDLTRLSNTDSGFRPLILSANNLLNEPYLKEIILQTKYAKPFFSRKNIRYKMKLQLQTIHSVNDWLVFGFRIVNNSSLDYDIDFTRMYIRDRQQVKRSSIQEQEIVPVYKDNLTEIKGAKEQRFIIIVPRFTIPDKKEFLIEVFEKNGGRNLSLNIKNRHLLKSKPL